MAPLAFLPSLFLGVIFTLVTKILSSPMTVAFNQHYLKAESFSIDTSQSFQNSSTVSWNPLIFRISYAEAFPSVSNLSVVIATDNMDIIHSGGSIQFSGKVTSKEESQLVFNFESNLSSFIKNLGYRYLILINRYSQANSNLIIESYSLSINLGINDSTPVEKSVPYDSSLLGAANNTIFIPFLTGVDISTTSSSNVLDINLHAEGNSTFINFLITSSLGATTFVRSLEFYLMIYDEDYYNRDQYAAFYFGQLSGTAGSGPLNYVNTGNVYEPNVMVGVAGFSFTTQTHSDFAITFSSPNELAASSSVSSCLLNLNYLVMKTFFCDQFATYYRQITNQTLPSVNLAENTCSPCPDDCETCDIKGNCLSCNSQTDHRQLEKNISRCKPQPGFYQSNVTVALKCGDGCAQCSSLNLCSACEQGFTPKYGLCALIICPPRTFLDSSICQQCPFDCQTCDSEGNCLSCSELDHRVFDNVSRCVPEGGFYEGNIRVSYACPPGCISCNGMSICFDCLTDYELIEAKCQIMVSTQCDKTGKNCKTNISLILGVTLGPLTFLGLICCCCKGKGGSVSPS